MKIINAVITEVSIKSEKRNVIEIGYKFIGEVGYVVRKYTIDQKYNFFKELKISNYHQLINRLIYVRRSYEMTELGLMEKHEVIPVHINKDEDFNLEVSYTILGEAIQVVNFDSNIYSINKTLAKLEKIGLYLHKKHSLNELIDLVKTNKIKGLANFILDFEYCVLPFDESQWSVSDIDPNKDWDSDLFPNGMYEQEAN